MSVCALTVIVLLYSIYGKCVCTEGIGLGRFVFSFEALQASIKTQCSGDVHISVIG